MTDGYVPESRLLKQRRLDAVTFIMENWPVTNKEVWDWLVDEQNKLLDALEPTDEADART